MNLISIENISKQLKDTPLFEGVSLGIHACDRIGLLGENGAGKTTFLKLTAGLAEPDSGMISRNQELTIGYLEQEPSFPPGCTVKQALYHGFSPMIDLLNAYHRSVHASEQGKASEAELSDLTEQMDRCSGWEIEQSYHSLLTELGVGDLTLPAEKLSGGMKKKTALARALCTNPNLLILDEPTNHLDIRTIEWLEKYILSARMGCITVTHDRYFLDAACTRIFEIDRRSIFTYDGNYSTFLEKKQERMERETAEQNKINSILRTELQWLRRGPKARTGKDKGRKQRIQDLMDSRTGREAEISEFSSAHRRLGKKVLEMKRVEKTYDGVPVIKPFSYKFKQGERIGLVGPNGSGKSTFLDVVTGMSAPDAGVIDAGANTVFGYYDQLNWNLPEQKTVLEFISGKQAHITVPSGKTVSASRFLESFGFDISYHRIPISRLSGGEKRRLLLISTLLQNPNFLVLDEPTNDLDMDTLRKLEDYLISFPGCLLIVSHDRAFLDRTTDYLFLFDGSGTIKGYAGSYSALRAEAGKQTTQSSSSTSTKQQPRKKRDEKKRKLSFKEQREFEALFEEIEQLEEEKNELEESFQQPSSQLEAQTKRYQEVLKRIEEATRRWEYLAEIESSFK